MRFFAAMLLIASMTFAEQLKWKPEIILFGPPLPTHKSPVATIVPEPVQIKMQKCLVPQLDGT